MGHVTRDSTTSKLYKLFLSMYWLHQMSLFPGNAIYIHVHVLFRVLMTDECYKTDTQSRTG